MYPTPDVSLNASRVPLTMEFRGVAVRDKLLVNDPPPTYPDNLVTGLR